MSKIFITGSADGLGQMAAKKLVAQGHTVVLHARNKDRGRHAMQQVPGAENVLTADLSNREETIKLANELNAMGSFDAIIHNAGVYQVSGNLILEVNTLAPYILTCLVNKPARLIYMSSGMHLQGDLNLVKLEKDPEKISYSDSKLHMVILAMAVARKWPKVFSNAVNPGWVPTKMGGSGAPDNLEKGVETQVWLAAGEDDQSNTSGNYFFHKRKERALAGAEDPLIQERFLYLCEKISGIKFPGG
jgi:NAD(P)-dependent dehydrogenase (short-subunit alcohol dehydrogenase family)